MVERVRQGKGDKSMLVIDMETEGEMQQRGEEINPNNTDDAIIMIPRVPPPPPPPEVYYTHTHPHSHTDSYRRSNS